MNRLRGLRVILPALALLWTVAAAAEQLIVFRQPGASALAERFEQESLPAIRDLAEDMGLVLIVRDAREGVPEEVGITPLIVFQNHAGRSIYQGRYTTLDRLGNFITTSRFMPQGDAKLERQDTPVWDLGRAKVAAPIKITDLAGMPPGGFDQALFAKNMREALAAGFERFEQTDRVALGKSDRMFYMDFYPYRSEDGKLFVSTALFSMFHCHEPVYTRMDKPIRGSWDDRAAVFAEAAAELEAQVARLLDESKQGDGFDVVPEDVPTRSWEALGLSLPPKPEDATTIDPADVELAREWTVDVEAQQERPAVTFTFPSPLEQYAGRVTKLTGELTLGESLALAQASGRFVVPVTAVTMGEPDLDEYIHSGMLKGREHPQSDFVFDTIESEMEALNFGPIIPAKLVGTFTMKGIPRELTVPVSIEAYVGGDGRPRVSISGTWSIRLSDPYDIIGPDGPEEASDTLVYRCHIVLEPAG
ncbi:MAG: hypothetical protein GVY24_01455 [Planctomycetes bacterium]|nr:hypothetical protein [Planctomycetota bacterium]